MTPLNTESTLNPLGQPVGLPLPNWREPNWPERKVLEHRFCRLDPTTPAHAADLFAAFSEDVDGRDWTYLSYGPFPKIADFEQWLHATCLGSEPTFYTIIPPDGRPAGLAAYLRITPAIGSVEVGHLHFAPRLQKSPTATAAMYLMADYAFSLGYRRYEWKCDALNAPSRSAALRLGFTYEGYFRQAMVYKGRTRDTLWFSIIDREWPRLKPAYERWLAARNFDAAGRQRERLNDLIRAALDESANG